MSKTIKTFKGTLLGKKRYFYLSPQLAHQLIVNLGLQIYQKIREGKMEKPEVIVAIAKGAWTWARSLADWLNISELSSIQIIHYQGVEERYKKPVILKSLPIKIERGTILLFDEVVETGKTINLAADHLLSMGAEKVISSALFLKTFSKFKPDFIAAQTAAWVIFHPEIIESIKDLASRWLNEGSNLKEVKNRFSKLKINKKELDYAMRLVFNFPSPL